MKIPNSGIQIDSPAYPLLSGLLSYWGATDLPGNAAGTTFICSDLANEPSYVGMSVKMISGPAAGQQKTLIGRTAGQYQVDSAFTNFAGAPVQILAGSVFVIGSASSMGAIASILGLTTYGQRTAVATDVDGTNWVDLLTVTTLTLQEEIWGITLTIAGGWIGLCEYRFVRADAGTKIFPFAATCVENTDFVSGIPINYPAPIVVPIFIGYILQFRSTNAGDVAGTGKTCTLTELPVIARG